MTPTAPSTPPRARPLHLRVGWIALVAAGGAIGTALREGISLLVQPIGSFPVAIFGINIVGAFVLGVLLEALALRGPDTGWRRRARLFAGTGILGGFTTYSALSTDSAELLTEGGFTLALAYGGATVLLGALASWAGILLGSRRAPRRVPRRAAGRPAATGSPTDSASPATRGPALSADAANPTTPGPGLPADAANPGADLPIDPDEAGTS